MDLTEGHVLCSHGSNALRIAFLEKINNEEAVKAKDVHNVFVLVLSLHRSAVTVSSTGAENQIQGDDNGHVGRPCEVSLAPPYPEPFASYGTSAVTRTSGRGHVAEAKTKPTSDIIDQIKPLPSPSPLSPMSSEFLDSNKSLHFFKKSTMCPAPVITVTRWSTSLITRCISQGSSKKKRTNALLLAYSPMR